MKTREITAQTEILANQMMELQEYVQNDEVIIINRILGLTTGTVFGIEPSISDGTNRVVAFTSGAISDGNGKFYEILETSGATLTLPVTDDTYYFYATQTETTDGEISGYILLDVNTRQEDFQSISTRTYDDITMSYNTTGVKPASSELIGRGIVTGGILTTIYDDRTIAQLGASLVNSLQQFVTNGLNDAYSSNKVTGCIIRDGSNFIEVDLGDINVAQGFKVNTGTRSDNIGYLANITGNIGFLADLQGAASGFIAYLDDANSVGFTTVNGDSTSIGFEAKGAGTGFKALNADVGYQSLCTIGGLFGVFASGALFNCVNNSVGIGINGDISNTTNGIRISEISNALEIFNSANGDGILVSSTGSSTANVNISSVTKEYGHCFEAILDGSTDSQTQVGLSIICDNAASTNNAIGIDISKVVGKENFAIGMQVYDCDVGIEFGNTNTVGITFTNNVNPIVITNTTSLSNPAIDINQYVGCSAIEITSDDNDDDVSNGITCTGVRKPFYVDFGTTTNGSNSVALDIVSNADNNVVGMRVTPKSTDVGARAVDMTGGRSGIEMHGTIYALWETAPKTTVTASLGTSDAAVCFKDDEDGTTSMHFWNGLTWVEIGS